MLGKKYSLGSVFEPTGEPLVKIANFEELKEQGNTVADFIKTFKPNPGFVYLHVIAMSAGEYWGCNINGDYFPEKDLIARHKTFETNAKVFKEHDNKPYSPDYGYVPFAWYNPKMHRVELILAIDKKKGPDIIARQERGDQLCVSMGTRVKYDICSICGNKSSKPTDYCEHIRFHKKEIFPDGKQAYMINPNPTFFDISIVRRPADKTAFVLSKVASSDNYKNLKEASIEDFENLGSELEYEKPAITWEIPEDDELLGDNGNQEAEKVAKIEGAFSNIEKTATLFKKVPAVSVKVINDEIHDFLPAMGKLEPELPTPLLDNLARNFSIKDILRSFLGSAIPMKPQEFTRIVIIKEGLPMTAFNDVLQGVLTAKPKEYIGGVVKKDIRELLTPYIESRSSLLNPVISRLNLLLGDIPEGMLKKEAASVFTPNPVMEYLDQNPRMNFGYVRRVPDFQNPTGNYPDGTVFYNPNPRNLNNTVPMGLDPEAYQLEVLRPSLTPSDKNKVIALGSILGRDYAAYKNPNVIMSALQEPDILSSLALILGGIKGIGNLFTNDTKQNNKGTDFIKVKTSSEDSPLENIVLEHLINSYSSNADPVYESLLKQSSIIDGTSYIDKRASAVGKAAKTGINLLPFYILRRSPSPVNMLVGFRTDAAAVSYPIKKVFELF